MARVTDRLVFELAQMICPRGRPTKDGLRVETKIGDGPDGEQVIE